MIFFAHTLKKLFVRWGIITLALTGLFSVGGVALRTLPIMSTWMIMRFVLLSMPVMVLYAIPFAASFVLYTVIGDFLVHNEIITISFFASLQRSLMRACCVFCTLIIMIYALFIFFITPQAYAYSKKMLIKALHEYVTDMPVNTVIQLGNAALYCSDKKITASGIDMEQYWSALNSKKDCTIITSLEQARLSDGHLRGGQGSIAFINGTHTTLIDYKKADIALESLLTLPSKTFDDYKDRTAKYLMLHVLIREIGQKSTRDELLRRIAFIWVAFLNCLIALFIAYVDPTKKNRVINGIGLSGLLFIMGHSSTAAAQALGIASLQASIVLYGGGIVCLVFVYFMLPYVVAKA